MPALASWLALSAVGILPLCPTTATSATLSSREGASWGFLAGSSLSVPEPWIGKANLEALRVCSLPWSGRHLRPAAHTAMLATAWEPPHRRQVFVLTQAVRGKLVIIPMSAEEAELEELSASPQGTHLVPLGSELGLFTAVPQPRPPVATGVCVARPSAVSFHPVILLSLSSQTCDCRQPVSRTPTLPCHAFPQCGFSVLSELTAVVG